MPDPTVYSDCDDCKTNNNEKCLTTVLQGCSTGTYYYVFDNINNQYVEIETGTTIQITMSNLTAPPGGLPENCFTGVSFLFPKIFAAAPPGVKPQRYTLGHFDSGYRALANILSIKYL